MLSMHPDACFSYMVYMDEHGNTEGNYTLIHRQKVNGKIGLHPAGVFQIRGSGSDLPVSQHPKLSDRIGEIYFSGLTMVRH